MRIHRIEHKDDGLGPCRTVDPCGSRGPYDDEELTSHLNRLPTPGQECKSEWDSWVFFHKNPSLVCGTTSIKKLNKWFPMRFRKRLMANYRHAVYIVPKSKISHIFKMQVIFDKSNATKKWIVLTLDTWDKMDVPAEYAEGKLNDEPWLSDDQLRESFGQYLKDNGEFWMAA